MPTMAEGIIIIIIIFHIVFSFKIRIGNRNIKLFIIRFIIARKKINIPKEEFAKGLLANFYLYN